MYDCILLSAGASSRMGALKPLLSFGTSTLVETAARSALGAGCRVLLVLGNRGEEVASLFETPDYAASSRAGLLLFARNSRWEEGLVGSIQAALSLVRGAAFFVAHADMPFVLPEDYAALAKARADRPSPARAAGEAAFFASFEGKAGIQSSSPRHGSPPCPSSARATSLGHSSPTEPQPSSRPARGRCAT